MGCLQLCNFIDWRNLKIVYKRYASLYFVTAIDNDDNELVALDMIHQFVEVLDKHFSNVCELDLVFHFYKAYWLMDEVFLAGAAPLPEVLVYASVVFYSTLSYIVFDCLFTVLFFASTRFLLALYPTKGHSSRGQSFAIVSIILDSVFHD